MQREPLSRRAFLKLSGGVAAAALLTQCGRPPQATTPPVKPTLDVGLEIQIGQMLMVGFRGLEVNGDHPIVQDIQHRHLGGVVLFDYDKKDGDRNIQSPDQVSALIRSLQAVAAIPLLVAIDHEGGQVTRLKEAYGFPATVSHRRMGEKDDLDYTRDQATTMAKTLAGLGINLNLAPVVDLNTNPNNPVIARYERSFSADPNIVISHAIEFIKAHHRQGILCALKHFPGHGSSAADSHHGLVDITETWSRLELKPYEKLIQAGRADTIMTAHVFNTELDPDDPATLSHPTISGLLRGELGYRGVVVSDDLQMEAITRYYGFETAVQKAIEAGVDILVFANTLVYEEDVVSRAVELIRGLVQEGTVSKERIEASYRRIQRLKKA